MFVGHLALGLMGKNANPKLSLGWPIAAATALDLVWPVLVLAGVERLRIEPGAMAFGPLVFESYPWSHSLLMACVLGVVMALLGLAFGARRKGAIVLGLLVVSHWVLDYITHGPDLPLWPGDPRRFGLGLWNSIPGTFLVESIIWLTGIIVYLSGRHARSWMGPVAFWSFVVVSTALWASGPWAPPPPSPQAVGAFAMIGWIVIPWAAIADHYYTAGHRG